MLSPVFGLINTNDCVEASIFLITYNLCLATDAAGNDTVIPARLLGAYANSVKLLVANVILEEAVITVNERDPLTHKLGVITWSVTFDNVNPLPPIIAELVAEQIVLSEPPNIIDCLAHFIVFLAPPNIPEYDILVVILWEADIILLKQESASPQDPKEDRIVLWQVPHWKICLELIIEE